MSETTWDPEPAPEDERPSSPEELLFDEAIERLERGEDGLERALAGWREQLDEETFHATLARARRFHAELAGVRRDHPPDFFAKYRAFFSALRGGDVLGDFVLEELLGSGNMGRVFRARQRALGEREVAVKVLRPELALRDPRFAERFRNEAALAAQVHHPSIAEVYGSGEADGHLYFAMRLVEGRPLDRVLAELVRRHRGGDPRVGGPEYARTVARLGRDLARALGAVHAAGLIHRDVKPSNVILEGAGEDALGALERRPVLLDFGLVRPLGGEGLTGERTLLLTPAYAAPEAQIGRHDLDARADVFCLGALLHDLLAPATPSERPLASAGLSDLGGINPRVDPRLAAIVRMATETRPELRYADGNELADELDAYLESRPILALPETRWGRLRLWVRREPLRAARWGSAIGLAIPLIAGVTWAATRVAAVYGLASAARGFEESGELVAARERFAQLEQSRLAGLLPGLADDLARAAEYTDPGGEMPRVLELLSRNARDAHARLTTMVLTPGRDEWDRQALSLLARELESAPDAGERDEELATIAAETATAYFIVHPLRWGWREEGAPLFARLGLEEGTREPRHDPRVWRPLLARLAGALEFDLRSARSANLRRWSAAALCGMTGPHAFDALLEAAGAATRAGDGETANGALSGLERILLQLHLEDRLPLVGEERVLRCAAVLATASRWAAPLEERGQPTSVWGPLKGYAGRVFDLCCRAILELREAGAVEGDPWEKLQDPGLAAQAREVARRISRWLAADAARREAILDEPPIEGGPVYGEPFTWTPSSGAADPQQELRGFREGAARMVLERPRRHPFGYLNIWLADEGGGEALNPAPDAVLVEPAVLGFRIGDLRADDPLASGPFEGSERRVRLSGSAVAARWRGARIVTDGFGERFLQFDRVGAPGLRVRFKPPSTDFVREHERPPFLWALRVRLQHGKANRAYLPGGGSARIRLWLGVPGAGAADRRLLTEQDALAWHSQLEVRVPYDTWAGLPELELTLELVSGTTTYRLDWIAIERVRAPALNGFPPTR